jgi:hypothetical protein
VDIERARRAPLGASVTVEGLELTGFITTVVALGVPDVALGAAVGLEGATCWAKALPQANPITMIGSSVSFPAITRMTRLLKC